jgi:hypothetical protein
MALSGLHDEGMSPAGRLRLDLSLLAALLLFSPLAAFAEDGDAHSKIAGDYRSYGEKKDPFMTVSLGEDGTATVSQDPGNGLVTFFGHWIDSGSEVTITFDPLDGKKEPSMVLQPNHGGLEVVTWNHALWGNVKPPPMKRAAKAKQLYWSTTVP